MVPKSFKLPFISFLYLPVFFFTKCFANLVFAFNGICYCRAYPRFGCKNRARLRHNVWSMFVQSLFIIFRNCFRAIFESGLPQCSFQRILYRSFLNFVLSKFLYHLCSLHVSSSFALVADGSIKNWISGSDTIWLMFLAVIFSMVFVIKEVIY